MKGGVVPDFGSREDGLIGVKSSRLRPVAEPNGAQEIHTFRCGPSRRRAL